MVDVTKTTFLLFLFRAVGLLVSIMSVTVTAKFFGVSIEKDCWILALALTTTIVQAVWGPLNEIFRAKFIFTLEEEGLEKVLNMTSSLVGFIIAVTSLIGIITYVFSEEISSFLIGNIPSDAIRVFRLLVVCLIPTMILNELTKITTSVLNAFEIFYIPEIVGALAGSVNIVLIIVLAPHIGIKSLLVANYVSVIFLLVINLYYLKKKGIGIWTKYIFFRFTYVKPFLIFALPFFLPYFVGQLNGITEKYIASLLGQGAVSSLDYASQFTKILQTLLSSVLATVMVPLLAKTFANDDMNGFVSIMEKNIKTCMIILILSCSFLVGASEPLCEFFFYRGKVNIDQLNVIIELTRLYGITFISVFLYLFSGYALLSLNRGKLYATVGVLTQIVVMFFFVIGYVIFNNLHIFPLSVGIAHLLAAFIMMNRAQVVFNKEIIWLTLRGFIGISIISIVVSLLNMYMNIENSFIEILLSGLFVLLLFFVISKPIGYNINDIISVLQLNKARWKKRN